MRDVKLNKLEEIIQNAKRTALTMLDVKRLEEKK